MAKRTLTEEQRIRKNERARERRAKRKAAAVTAAEKESKPEEVCEHFRRDSIKRVTFVWKGREFEINVDRCCNCGKYCYSYDNFEDRSANWQSVSDVKEYIKKHE